MSSDGTQIEVNDASTASYKLSVDDIGFFVSVSCEPVRRDWARGPIVLSEQIGPIIAGIHLISWCNLLMNFILKRNGNSLSSQGTFLCLIHLLG